MFHCGLVAPSSKHAVNMTFCGPARDTVLTNRQTEKLNFDTNYITINLVPRAFCFRGWMVSNKGPASCSIYCSEYSGFLEHWWNGTEDSHMTVLNCSDYPDFRVGVTRTDTWHCLFLRDWKWRRQILCIQCIDMDRALFWRVNWPLYIDINLLYAIWTPGLGKIKE
jgi:hypothetical protein